MTMKRELIEVHGEKRYIRRDAKGRFTSNQVNAGRSPASDSRDARTTARPGRGDQRRG